MRKNSLFEGGERDKVFQGDDTHDTLEEILLLARQRRIIPLRPI